MESKKVIVITPRKELIIVSSIVGLLAMSLIVPWNIPRAILGIPFVLFLPGYAFLSAIFPGKGKLDLLERLIISAGFSLVIVSLLAFVINYTPWGLRLVPLFIGYSLFTMGSSITSYHIRKRMAEQERFEIEIPLRVPMWKTARRVEKVISLVLICSIVIAIGSIGFAIINPKLGEKFTELYVLGKDDKASNYPVTIRLGEPATVKVGVVNQEQRSIPYRLEITIGGTPTFTKNPISLEGGQRWEEPVPLDPVKLGKQQKVEINIYRPEDTRPYQYLILWVDVIEKGS